jgi:hypothetical protein
VVRLKKMEAMPNRVGVAMLGESSFTPLASSFVMFIKART